MWGWEGPERNLWSMRTGTVTRLLFLIVGPRYHPPILQLHPVSCLSHLDSVTFSLTIFYHIFKFPYPNELASYFIEKLSLWGLRPPLILPPPLPTSRLSTPTFISTCLSQVSKGKVYFFLLKTPAFSALGLCSCCLLQERVLFSLFYKYVQVSPKS